MACAAKFGAMLALASAAVAAPIPEQSSTGWGGSAARAVDAAELAGRGRRSLVAVTPPGVCAATTIKTVANGFCYNDGKSKGDIYSSWGHSEASCTEQCGARGDCVASQFLGGRCVLFKASGCTGSGLASDGRVQNLWCDRYFSPGCTKKVVNGFCYNDGKSRGYIYDSFGHTESSCTEQCGARGDCVASQFLGGRCTLFKASGCTGSGITSDGRVQNLWCDRYSPPSYPAGTKMHHNDGAQCQSGNAGLWNDQKDGHVTYCCRTGKNLNNWAKGWCADMENNDRCIFDGQCKSGYCRNGMSSNPWRGVCSTPPLAPGAHCDTRPNHHPSCNKCKNAQWYFTLPFVGGASRCCPATGC